jgi:hypothetical protein
MKLKRFKFNFIGRMKGRPGFDRECEAEYSCESLAEAYDELYNDYENISYLSVMVIR